jgi:hypothetical protein
MLLVATFVVSLVKRTVIVAVPTLRAVTRPVEDTVATLLFDENHESCAELPVFVESWVVVATGIWTSVGRTVSAVVLFDPFELFTPATVPKSAVSQATSPANARPARHTRCFRILITEEEFVPRRVPSSSPVDGAFVRWPAFRKPARRPTSKLHRWEAGQSNALER